MVVEGPEGPEQGDAQHPKDEGGPSMEVHGPGDVRETATIQQEVGNGRPHPQSEHPAEGHEEEPAFEEHVGS